MNESWRQIALAKGSQRYVFRYCRGEEHSVLDAFRSLAGDPRSGFDWFDAAVLCFKMARRLEAELQTSETSHLDGSAAGALG